MPTNVTAEYVAAELEYTKASTIAEKIKALEKMLSTCPTHKGCEKLRQEIKTKLAKFREKLEKQEKKKAKGYSISIKKEGAATICLVGFTNSGKSLLLNKLTNKKAEVKPYEFTTTMPEVGIMKYKGLKLQIIELPAITQGYAEKGNGPSFFSIIRNSDLVVIVTDTSDLKLLFEEFDNAYIKLNEKIYEDMEDSWVGMKGLIVLNKIDEINVEKVYQGLCNYYNFDIVKVSALKEKNLEKLKDELWEHLGKIKVYTKEPGKKAKIDEPVCLEKKSTIENMAAYIHKDFVKKFRFARVWGKSAKFDGQMCGLNHKLEDDDIVEIHTK